MPNGGGGSGQKKRRGKQGGRGVDGAEPDDEESALGEWFRVLERGRKQTRDLSARARARGARPKGI